MKKLRLAYLGSPELSAQFLEKLLISPELSDTVSVDLVVTQSDKPVGRKQTVVPSPVKKVAQTHRLLVKDGRINELAKFFNDIDLGLIYFYGQIIPKNILDLPRFGFWNIHFSKLPLYRGPTPATFSLVMGDKNTAVSLVQTDEKLDRGELVAQQTVKINSTETRIELEKRLHDLSFNLFRQKLSDLLENRVKTASQKHEAATYTRFPNKNDGFIPYSVLKQALQGKKADFIPSIIDDFCKKNKIKYHSNSLAETIFDLYRGLSPWPGIWTLVQPTRLDEARRLKITNMVKNNDRIILKTVQLEGKKEVDYATFQRAYELF